MTDIHLDELCTEVFAQLAGQAKDKNITVTEYSKSQGQDQIIRSNQQLLYIMLRNLLDNAIRYGPENSGIKFILEKQQHQAWIRIQDEGPSIPRSQLNQVRQIFFRLARRETAGCGLGL